MAPRRRTVSLIAATIGLTATACGGGSTSGLAPSGSTSPTTDHSTSAAPGLATDERLKPGVRYTDASDFTPPVSLAVPTGHWYPYLRGNGALSLRVASGPAEGQAVGKGIEVVQESGTVAGVINELFSSQALHPGKAHSFSVAGQPGRWYDVTITRKADLAKPPSLAGEQVDPAEGLRVFAIGGDGSALVALVITDHRADLAGFLDEATHVVNSFRISR